MPACGYKSQLYEAGGHFGQTIGKTKCISSTQTHAKNQHPPQTVRTCGDVPDQQGRVGGEGETMTGAAVQDGISGDLQRQFGLEALTGHAVGALRPPIAKQSFSDEAKRIRGYAADNGIPINAVTFVLLKLCFG